MATIIIIINIIIMMTLAVDFTTLGGKYAVGLPGAMNTDWPAQNCKPLACQLLKARKHDPS